MLLTVSVVVFDRVSRIMVHVVDASYVSITTTISYSFLYYRYSVLEVRVVAILNCCIIVVHLQQGCIVLIIITNDKGKGQFLLHIVASSSTSTFWREPGKGAKSRRFRLTLARTTVVR